MEPPGFLSFLLPENVLAKLSRGKAVYGFTYKAIPMARLSHGTGTYTRGTVASPGRLVYGFPQIKRVFHLENGIARHMKGNFYVEEKIDGYNCRIAVIEGTLAAFTRGGFVCPYTVDRAPGLLNLSIFDSYPKHVICGEVAGPENPYNNEPVPFIKEDVRFFAFDVMDETGRLLAPGRKYELLDRFGINTVRHWGPFGPADYGEIAGIVSMIDHEGGEGIVMKPAGTDGLASEGSIKYVTAGSCARDIASAAPLMAELPAGFYIQRLWRVLFNCMEFGWRPGDETVTALMRPLFESGLHALETVQDGGAVTEEFTVKVTRSEVCDALIEHLKELGVQAKIISVEKDGALWKARFKKYFPEGTKDLKRKLKGEGFYD